MNELDNENDYALVFDHFYTNNHIQILKSLLPFFDTGASSYLPVFIKYLELQHTIALVRNGIHLIEPGIKAASKQAPNPEDIYHAIQKYLTPNEEKSLQQIINMMHTLKNVKEMQKMMELFQSMSGEENTSSNPFPDFSNIENMMGGSFDMGDMLQFLNNIKN